MRGGSGGGVGSNEVGDGDVKVDNQGEVREQWEGISIDEGRTRPPVGGLGRRRQPAAEDVLARGSRYLGHGSLEAHHGEQPPGTSFFLGRMVYFFMSFVPTITL